MKRDTPSWQCSHNQRQTWTHKNGQFYDNIMTKSHKIRLFQFRTSTNNKKIRLHSFGAEMSTDGTCPCSNVAPITFPLPSLFMYSITWYSVPTETQIKALLMRSDWCFVVWTGIVPYMTLGGAEHVGYCSTNRAHSWLKEKQWLFKGVGSLLF